MAARFGPVPFGVMAIAIVIVAASCDAQSNPSKTPPPALPEASASPSGGHGGAGGTISFATPSELAHHFKVSVFSPVGVALHGGIDAETDASGVLGNYGIGLFNGYGSLYVSGPAPSATAEFRTAADDDPQRTTVARQIVAVQGHDAILYNEIYGLSPRLRLLWSQEGRLLQIVAPAQVGALAVIAVANATQYLGVDAVDTANVIVDTRPNPAGGSRLLASPADAATLLGRPVFAPANFVRVLVWPDQVTGRPARWEIYLDETTIVSDAPSPSDADLRRNGNVTTLTHPTVAGNPSTYVKAGVTSSLYFSRAGARLKIQDRTGARDEQSLVAIANSLQQTAPGATLSQPVATVALGAPARVGQTVQVPINVSGTVDVLGFNVHLRWDPGVFTFSSANSSGSIIPSPFCAQSLDGDGTGIVYGCASTGTHGTQTGLLATIVLTPASSGCSTLHLVTYGGADNGDSGNGSYLMAPDNTPQDVSYGPDVRVDVNGQAC